MTTSEAHGMLTDDGWDEGAATLAIQDFLADHPLDVGWDADAREFTLTDAQFAEISAR